MASPTFESSPKKDTQYIEHLEDPKADRVNVSFAQNVNAKYVFPSIYWDVQRLIIFRIVNPLGGISKSQLFSDVAVFCQSYGLDDKLSTFEKGALVAQNPDDIDNIEELTEEDRYHLRREVTHKWHLTKALYFTIGVCSLGSALQGWDNTGANGANLSFPEEFGIAHNTWLVGLINAAPTISGLFASWLADPLNNWWGRRGVIFFTGLFCVFPVLGQAFARNWYELLITRLIIGVGLGIKITTIPIMTSEVVPANIRGGLVMSFQLWVAFGILVGFSSNLIFMNIGRLAWRFQLGAAFAPAIPVLILIWYCPGMRLSISAENFADFTSKNPHVGFSKSTASKIHMLLSAACVTPKSKLREICTTRTTSSLSRRKCLVVLHSSPVSLTWSASRESEERRWAVLLLWLLNSKNCMFHSETDNC